MPDMQQVQDNFYVGDQAMYVPSVSPLHQQTLPCFDTFPQTYPVSPTLPQQMNTADVLLNQMATEMGRGAAEMQPPADIVDDNSQNISNILDLDQMQQISLTDSDIIRFMENTAGATATSMDDNMSDSLSRLRIYRS